MAIFTIFSFSSSSLLSLLLLLFLSCSFLLSFSLSSFVFLPPFIFSFLLYSSNSAFLIPTMAFVIMHCSACTDLFKAHFSTSTFTPKKIFPRFVKHAAPTWKFDVGGRAYSFTSCTNRRKKSSTSNLISEDDVERMRICSSNDTPYDEPSPPSPPFVVSVVVHSFTPKEEFRLLSAYPPSSHASRTTSLIIIILASSSSSLVSSSSVLSFFSSSFPLVFVISIISISSFENDLKRVFP
mmetsp:Transcript_2213/g.7908  ORF Transcript_2213/g.7908 Transcript_2213/m.7908 type:complete len:238 (+) Transcript_2213:960-1673(+)